VSFANKLNQLNIQQTLDRTLGYASSVDHEPIKVEDLGMGTTGHSHQKTP
jgi:hypothetical protein